MFVGKITAYYITGSSAILSDAIESVVHIMATGLTLYSIILSTVPADRNHLYGHGNIEYFSAGAEGLLIVIAALTIIYFAVIDLIEGPQLQKLDTGVIIIGSAGLLNLFLGFYLVKKGKLTNSIALVADGKHVLTDSITSLGVLVALIIVLITKYILLDPIMAIFVALNIIWTGYKLMRESFGGLMNETDKALLETITQKIIGIRKSFWIDIHHFRFWKSAERIFVDLHLTLPYYFTIKQSHQQEDEISELLTTINPNAQVVIHMDYCDEALCKFCDFIECEVRKEPRSKVVDWNTDKLLGDPLNVKSHLS